HPAWVWVLKKMKCLKGSSLLRPFTWNRKIPSPVGLTTAFHSLCFQGLLKMPEATTFEEYATAIVIPNVVRAPPGHGFEPLIPEVQFVPAQTRCAKDWFPSSTPWPPRGSAGSCNVAFSSWNSP